MNCINRAELELYLKGTLSIERLLAVDAHLSTCTSCKMALQGLPAQQKAGVALGANLLGLLDCPEYEMLSAYVDGTLDSDEARSITAHANFCEECARDIARIEELRGHAAMRETVEVFPGMTRQAGRSVFGYWKQAAAVLSGAVLVAAVALSVGQFGSKPNSGGGMAVDEQTEKHRPLSSGSQVAENNEGKQPVLPPSASNNSESSNSQPVDNNNVIETPITKPNSGGAIEQPKQYATVLKDGDYSVVKRNGRYELATADGVPVRTELEARIAASVSEKLRTGKIKPAESYEVASAGFGLRDDGMTVSAAAPSISTPKDQVLLTDKPTFNWSESEMAESYVVAVYDMNGTPVIEETLKDNTFTPSSPLPRGKVYKWRVGVRFNEGDEWLKSESGVFSIVSDKDYATIQKLKSKGSHLALGAAYEYFGLDDEAAAEYDALAKQNPKSELARKLAAE